ncbi:MAG: hypothetical protein LCH54_06040 [Bacteroidetes bacterium]|nr:hypothetical protein [Bacteroidota bacterium]
MQKIIYLFLFLTISSISNAQINHSDSTVQIIAYWVKGDSDTYSISHEKFKVKDGDTSKTEIISYDAVLSIIDSTDEGYTCSWKTINLRTENVNDLLNKILKQSENITLIFKTNTLGSFLEVSNWEEIRNEINKAFDEINKQFENNPESTKLVTPMIEKFRQIYGTKEGIETYAIEEVKIMLSFYGYKYKLGEEFADSIKIPNAYGDVPFDAGVLSYLDEIDSLNNTYTIKREQRVNGEQLEAAVKGFFISTIGDNQEAKDEILKLENFSNTMYSGAMIHDTGWVLEGWNIKKTKVENTESVESIFIDIK